MNDQQLLRFSRHILLPQMDIEGQQALLDARVLVVGAGGLGCPVIQYLAASGVGAGEGELMVVDDDVVELSNLQRQTAHGTDDIGKAKVESAKEDALRLNPDCNVTALQQRADLAWLTKTLSAGNIDLIIDCTDNANIRYLLNQACLEHKIPWVSGAAVGLSGQITVFDPRQAQSPCYRCLYSDLDDQQLTCSENGVLSPLVGVIGSMQAIEALKLIADIGKPAVGKLMTFDAAGAEWRNWKLSKSENCPDCCD
ncbi:MAG: molybdopterin-synthase adenylyltransferase MoeB [Saccharospirillaceae bacterium]|nr:molybdopterin-synthase adenylyltransferase MoeB [Thalassolituus sp. HI0120]MCH2040598.1 molybdopterin-synthase adenylyltransferase MoeB [Saccharospirillaceae bacterium]